MVKPENHSYSSWFYIHIPQDLNIDSILISQDVNIDSILISQELNIDSVLISQDLNSDLEEYGKDYKFISEQGADIQESKTLSFHQLTSGCNLYIIMKKEDGGWRVKWRHLVSLILFLRKCYYGFLNVLFLCDSVTACDIWDPFWSSFVVISFHPAQEHGERRTKQPIKWGCVYL